MNSYDEACQMYLDKKIDSLRFKKRYYNDIDTLRSSPVQQNRLYPKEKSKYQAFHKIVEEWFNLEK